MAWQRARSSEQKETRRGDIRRAAAELFDQRGFDSVPLADIAGEVGMSKAALYRYFGSKEEIYLDLLLGDLETWTAELEAAMESLSGSNNVDAVASVLTETFQCYPRLAALMAIMAGTLEHNIDIEAIASFKSGASALGIRAAATLRPVLPALTDEDVFLLLRRFIALANGLWPQAHPSPMVREVLARPEFNHMRIDIGEELQSATAALLHGMVAKSRH